MESQGRQESDRQRANRTAREIAAHLPRQERLYIAALIVRKEYLWGWLNAHIKSEPSYHPKIEELQALKWAIKKLTEKETA
jgi:hypothetical protein